MRTKLKDYYAKDLPREKLKLKGAENLQDHELLAILLGTGSKDMNVLAFARSLLKRYPKKKLATLCVDELQQIKGIGLTKASILNACFELSRRALDIPYADNKFSVIQSEQDIYTQCEDIADKRKEHFVVLYLNARNQVLAKEIISIGIVNQSLVHPREVFAPALEHVATSIICVHNHPSQDPLPSDDDLRITKQLMNAGKILGIQVMDHFVICKNLLYSIKEHQVYACS